MGPSHDQLPDLQVLTRSFNTTFNDDSVPEDRVVVLSREPNPRASTYPSEVVTCRLTDGSELQLLCKYADGRIRNSYGHRGGVGYEAKVYEEVLRLLPVSTPKCYGTHEDPATGRTWIILEYFDNCERVKDSSDPALMPAAARWLGRFHRVNEADLPVRSLSFLNRHDAEYYLGWANRTSVLAAHLHERFPWLMTLCERFEEVVGTLLESPIIIHGEYYPNNILFARGKIWPADWESAAVAIGEVDLASLMEGWPPETVETCQVEYQRTRWPEGTPADFERKLDVAQLYWHLRWLGDRPKWTHQEGALQRFARLQDLGQRLGLIER